MPNESEPRRLGLDDAYAVRTPDDNRALYRDWAETYESDFVASRGYVYHEQVANLLAEFAADRGDLSAPTLDVGCGTGVVGVALAPLGFTTIDGVDISPEMLEQAETKGVYRALHVADLTRPLDIEDGAYAHVVSAGTFTHGHLGPEPIDELVRITAVGGCLTLGINAHHFVDAGFADALDEHARSGRISGLTSTEVPMYCGGDDERADDLARVVNFYATGAD